ncbi:MAG: rod shape-determining protein RodA [Bacteroidales bacterium]|uniref:rod shape-determining protein RodA n=1 Tax=Porphyromonas sp. TaxID=1924944 RepID=UPI00297B36E3|nr:rod shape-determining protein RodA [Porphyromonas sp.]MDD7438850.1 rod shape-determining protein RodA [Bacteroidales bacterium]MDY3067729.1 rod shape-determining protein RodA [Porphyromonas sp.]
MTKYSEHNKSPKPLQGVDLPIIFLYLIMIAIGWFTIYAAGYDPDLLGESLVIDGRPKSQLLWMGISFIVALVILLVEPRFIRNSSSLLYGTTILILIATIFLAPNIKGSHSWLVITETIRIQPAEFAKVTTAMMLAMWCSRYDYDIKKPRELLVALLIFLLPIFIIILQSETGSALVFLAFILVLYREGLTSAVPFFGILLITLFVVTLRFNPVTWGITPAGHLLTYLIVYISTVLAIKGYSHIYYRHLLPALLILPGALLIAALVNFFMPVNYAYPAFIALVALLLVTIVQGIQHKGKYLIPIAVVAVITLVLTAGVEYFFDEVLQAHQQTRILVSLGLKDDPSGAGYNVRQSLIAIGSGGPTGKGFLQGTQTKLSFVPEQDTDFIFCTIGEEQGFIGSIVLLSLFTALILRVIYISERQVDAYVRIYGYSVASILLFHLIINIGMVIGLVPVIGIPLPFISYGGSSLLSFTILLFTLLRLDSRNRDYNI